MIQSTLIRFEEYRKQQGIIPPIGSNSFYSIGEGKINLFTIRDSPDDYRFDISTDSGKLYTGAGNFIVSGDTDNVDHPYRNMTIISNTSVSVNQFLTIEGGVLDSYGTLELLPHSQLRITGGDAILHPNSILIINDQTNLSVSDGATLTIYGRIDVHISVVDSILNAPNVIVDSAAVMNVSGIEYTDRIFSLSDYDHELRKTYINVNTQGERNFPGGRSGHIWRMGSPSEPSQVVGLNIQYGNMPLGDFRLSILGLPNETFPNMQTVSDLVIRKGTTLNITEKYDEFNYIRPELYLGVIIGNTRVPANCIVEGTIRANGLNSLITIDRGSTLHISESGTVILTNGAIMRSTHNENTEVLFIDGTLIIDDISQIETFNDSNIKFGPKGKVVIVNPDIGEKRLLFTTPIGIKSSEVYRIFLKHIDHMEYHIQKNTGIGIDQYFELYSRDFTDWFAGRRLEKAIHDGIIVWHDNAYIEMYHHITPWIDENSNLLHAGRIFKSYGSYDSDKLQDAVNRLNYVGCGDILFRFINGDAIQEVTLILKGINMKSIIHNSLIRKFVLTTDNEGMLFIRNLIADSSINNIIHPTSRSYNIGDTKRIEFALN